MSRWFGFVALAISVSLTGHTTFAQGDAMVEIYGQGVHHYFAGDYAGAEHALSSVIDSGSSDPRAHYFLGLAKYMQGNPEAAQSDFENGSRAEATGKASYAVGFALQRVQGHVRGVLEKARRDARIVARQQQMELQRVRMEQIRMQPPAPPVVVDAALSPPADAANPAATNVAESDPFGSGEGLRSSEITTDPVQPGDPLSDEPAAAAGAANAGAPPAAGDNPFQTPAATPPATPAEDPFGTPPLADDPFK